MRVSRTLAYFLKVIFVEQTEKKRAVEWKMTDGQKKNRTKA